LVFKYICHLAALLRHPSHLVAPEEDVGAVEVVENAEDAVALVELEVVEVVRFRRGKEREVVAGVSIQRRQQGQAVPKPGWKTMDGIMRGFFRNRPMFVFISIHCVSM
jgi:hypothetical protein